MGDKTPIWSAIAQSLRADIAEGRYPPGDKLPTGAVLASRFGVNRHTVRRALKDLAEAGVVFTRRGSGVFVAHRPTDYPIGTRVRFHQNLRAAGRLPAKQILALETRAADAAEAEALHLVRGELVHVYDGLSLADGMPVATFRSSFSAARFPGMLKALERLKSVTEALREHGVADYTRASTRLTAKLASPTQALHLQLEPGAPILRSIAVNVNAEGEPIEYGRTWFAGERIALTLGDA